MCFTRVIKLVKWIQEILFMLGLGSHVGMRKMFIWDYSWFFPCSCPGVNIKVIVSHYIYPKQKKQRIFLLNLKIVNFFITWPFYPIKWNNETYSHMFVYYLMVKQCFSCDIFCLNLWRLACMYCQFGIDCYSPFFSCNYALQTFQTFLFIRSS